MVACLAIRADYRYPDTAFQEASVDWSSEVGITTGIQRHQLPARCWTPCAFVSPNEADDREHRRLNVLRDSKKPVA
jgi:hypothetical protein